jgi:hypothetical protein
METAAGLIVHSAVGHLVERECGHLQRASIGGPVVIAQQKVDTHARWKLWGSAEPAFARIEAAVERAGGRVEYINADCSRAASRLHALIELLP